MIVYSKITPMKGAGNKMTNLKYLQEKKDELTGRLSALFTEKQLFLERYESTKKEIILQLTSISDQLETKDRH